MNKHDSERVAGLLESFGHLPSNSYSEADLIVVNTCAVRERSVTRLRGYIRSLGEPHKRGAIIAIGGCVSEAEKENIFKKMPFINIVFGPDTIDELPYLIEESLNRGKALSLGQKDNKFASDLPVSKENKFQSWMAITKGCDNYCSYCIVPFVRGRERSRPIELILKEAREMLNSEVKEITLLGQNVNSYGRDLFGKPYFAYLLAEIAEIGIPRVRFATSHPKDFSPDIIKVMKAYKNICPQIHLPVQSGSDRILKLMNRGYTQKEYLSKVELIRSKIDGVGISTDIMVGFPGESEEDFEETLKVIKEASFEQAFTFIYSPRPYTKAATMKEQVPDEVKKERFGRLVQETKKTALKSNEMLIGKVEEILVEGKAKKGNALFGRTLTGKVVNFISKVNKQGDFIKVKITEAGVHHLNGEIYKR